jgi:hypothetical protein
LSTAADVEPDLQGIQDLLPDLDAVALKAAFEAELVAKAEDAAQED